MIAVENKYRSSLTLLLAGVVLLIMTYLVVGKGMGIVLQAALLALLFLVGFSNVILSLAALVLSILLSPEITMGSTAERSVTVRFDDLILVVLTLGWMVRVAILKDIRLFLRNPLNKPIFAYSVIAVVATGLGAYRGYVDMASGFFFVAKLIEYFVLFMIITNYVQRKQDVNMVINIHILAFALVCAYGVYQIVTGGDISAPFEGSAGERNTLGGYLALMGCVSGGILLYSESLLEKRLLFGLMAVAFVVLLFSMSRSGWLAGFVGAVVLFLFARQKRVFLLIVCLLLLVFPFVVPDAAVERFDFTFGQSIHPGMHVELFGVRLDTSSSARIQSWLHALHRIPRHLLFGYGITGFSFLDGQFVRVLAETGVLGLLAFLWLLWQTHHLILQALRADNLGRREAGMLTGFYAGFWAIIAHALTTNSFIIIRIAEPFWCLAGLAVVILSQHKEDVDAPSHATTGA